MEKQQENPINKKDNKCFQYSVKVALNQEEIKKDPQRIIQLKPFKNKYITGKEQNTHQRKMMGKNSRKKL